MSPRMMLVSVALLSGLAACDVKPTEIGPGAGGRGEPTKAAVPSAPVKLPPAIAASKQFRCSDNSLVFVDFYSDDLSASMRTARDGKPVRLAAPTAGETMVADGFSLKGGRRDDRIVVTTPEHPKPLSCHV